MRNIKGIRVSQDLFDDLAPGMKSRPTWMSPSPRKATRIPSPAPLIPAVRLRHGDHLPVAPHNWHATPPTASSTCGTGAGDRDHGIRNALPLASLHPDSYPNLEHEVVGERRVFQVRCEAILIDLRAAVEPRLVDRNDYSPTSSDAIYGGARESLLAPSARGPGTCAAIFRAEALSRSRLLPHLSPAVTRRR